MLVTKKAPDFTATAVLANGQIVDGFNLMENLGEKGAVLFSTHLTLLLYAHQKLLHFHTEQQSLEKEV